jgi:hypothetical protein
MPNLPEIAYWLRGLPNPHELADALEQAAKIEELTAAWNDQVGPMEAKQKKLEADIARLEKEKTDKFHEVGAVVPEAEGHARSIIEAAKAKAAELVKDAEAAAAKVRADADAYSKRVRSAVEKFKGELA